MLRSSPLVLLVAWLCFVPRAAADDMDITLARFRIPAGTGGCTATGENGLARAYCPDNDSYRRLMADLGGAILSVPTGPAATTGFGGFQLTLGGSMTGIDETSKAWILGTEGDQRADANGNPAPASTLLIAYGEVRKGLPFGFEVGGSVGHVLQTGLYVIGFDARWGMLPDVAVAASLKTVVGDSEFSMTLPALSLIVSKRFVIGETWTLSPFVAGQVAWVAVDSDLVDLTPDVNAYDACVPDLTDPNMACTKAAEAGKPAPGADYNNNATFESMSSLRGRLHAGAEGRFQHFVVSAAVILDVTSPTEAPAGTSHSVSGVATAGFRF